MHLDAPDFVCGDRGRVAMAAATSRPPWLETLVVHAGGFLSQRPQVIRRRGLCVYVVAIL